MVLSLSEWELKKSSKICKVEGFNDDGRYVYTKEGGGFTTIKATYDEMHQVGKVHRITGGRQEAKQNSRRVVGQFIGKWESGFGFLSNCL